MATILKTSEAAELLNVDVDTLRDFCATEGLPHFRIGTRYRFNKDEVLAWLDTYRVAGWGSKRVLDFRSFLEPYVSGMGEPSQDGVIRSRHVVEVGGLYRITVPNNYSAGTVAKADGYFSWVLLIQASGEVEMDEAEADKFFQARAAGKVGA